MDTSEKQEDEILPQYNIITEENQYEFIIWCSELKPPSISILKFNMLLQINMEKWVYQNNITWQYAYANTIDTLKAQQEIENSIKQEELEQAELEQAKLEQVEHQNRMTMPCRESGRFRRALAAKEELEQEELELEDRKKKPLDKIKRRELFAKRAEERQKYKKRKSI
tara:strand:- start:3253 stop:3756 length:504 start_codon:yes stop_codon:yes gene_type:complete